MAKGGAGDVLAGIVAGLLWSAIGLPFAGIPAKAVTSIGNMATLWGLWPWVPPLI